MAESVAKIEYVRELGAHVQNLRSMHMLRDFNAQRVLYARTGDWDKIDEDAFSEAFPGPIIANRIEEMAKGGVAALSIMPSFRCRAAVNGASETQKKRAAKRTNIVNHYMYNANLGENMVMGADHLISFGMVVTQIAMDWDEKMPLPVVRDSLGFYPVWDMLGRTKEVAHVFRKRIIELMAEYPEFAAEFVRYQSRSRDPRTGGDMVEWEVVHHDDGEYITLFVPACNNMVISKFKNPVGRCLFVCTKRPTIDGKIRGVFDDAVWVQMAANHMQMLMIQGTEKAVDAPIATPPDVSEVPVGPDTLLQSAQSEKIRRVDLNVPPSVYTAVQSFQNDLQSSALVGNPTQIGDPSVITGKGIEALMSGYSQLVAVLQHTMQGHYRTIAETCLQVDETLWPNEEKYIEGYRDGNEYEETYVPSKDIRGNYKVDVSFGTSTGLDQNRHLVYMLQALGARLFSKDTVIRALPGEVNADDEMRKIEAEQGREAIGMAISGLASSIAGMVAQGQDPAQTVAQVAAYVRLVQEGKQPEDAVEKVWPMPEPQEQPQDPMAAMMAQAQGGGPQDVGGLGALEQLQLGQDPASDLQMMMAGLTSSGQPNLQAAVSQQRPAF